MTTTNTALYINLWIGNLGKYNEGELVGEWFTLPCDMSEVSKTIGLNAQYEEYQINDFETNISGLNIHHYSNVETLNKFMEYVNDLDEAQQLVLQAHIENEGSQWVLENYDSIELGDSFVFWDCDNMSDVAAQYLEETGADLAEIIKENNFYIDEESLLRDLQLGGDIQNYYFDTVYEQAIEEGLSDEAARIKADEYETTDEEDQDFLQIVIESSSNEFLSRYFDYEAYGRDMSFEGTYIFLEKHCVNIF